LCIPRQLPRHENAEACAAQPGDSCVAMQRARILDIMSPKSQLPTFEQRRPSSCPAAVMPPLVTKTPDAKGAADQVREHETSYLTMKDGLSGREQLEIWLSSESRVCSPDT